MVLFGGILSVISVGITQVLSVLEKIVPFVSKIVDVTTSGRKNEPEVHPNCQVPICGQSPNYCPEQQLTPECRQRRMQIANTISLLRTTMASNLKDDDDDTTTKASSTSSNSTMMLVLVAAIGLAIGGFLYMRFKQGNNNKNNDRRSSTWSV